VSCETAAYRFTNLATRRLDIPVHFMRIASTGEIYKAYENDGVHFPTDATGAIEGQQVGRYWTARAVFNRPDVSSAYQKYRHHIGYVLVHRCGRPDSGGAVLRERRSAFTPR
jgi:XRE family transcriptional regulator, fatty acid utilization regulator